MYLDACCLNRPFDDSSQARIRLEAEAVIAVLRACERGTHQWVGSSVLQAEIGQTPDPIRREALEAMTADVGTWVMPDEEATRRAHELAAKGLGAFDALHVAVAEQAHCDVMLTTDDRLIGCAERLSDELSVQVRNPVSFAMEAG